ncbi:MAG: aromatic amino acid ammonia-lyase [Marinicella sp.]|nr:aromatic amino acid lyase [Xanthomonadales bacterium]
MKQTMEKSVYLGADRVDLATVSQLFSHEVHCQLNDQMSFVNHINQGAVFLQETLADKGIIYGVTTGFGDSCDVAVSESLAMQMPKNLYTFHGCGTGRFLSPEQSRMVLAVRLVSLCQGVSGVRYELLQQLTDLLNHNILPLIPEEGSVGASGDLTPLSYVAAVLCGERSVFYQGKVCTAKNALRDAGIKPLQLKPKEGLAIMNGTAVMTALGIEAYFRAQYLAQLNARITALASIALGSSASHFDEFLFSVKPHPGQQQIAAWIRGDLQNGGSLFDAGRLQERYSIRCAPHVIGVLQDILPWYKNTLENELNSANDNPIINGDAQTIHHGGHFYGGHIAFVMDAMKNNVANLSDLMDRQMALLVDVKFNHGLPRNLTGADNNVQSINHGFKAVQIACSAWTAEALKLTMPASVFSRSTESHNQDKVSMGTIAARDCLRVLELAEQTTAATLMAAIQGIKLRVRQGELQWNHLAPSLQSFINDFEQQVPFLVEDRALDQEIKLLATLIRQKHWPLYE